MEREGKVTSEKDDVGDVFLPLVGEEERERERASALNIGRAV